MISWDDVVHDVKNNFENLDKPTLKKYLKVPSPTFNNPGLVDQVRAVREQIMLRLTQIESAARDQRQKRWYEKPFGLILIGVIIVILGYFATEFISYLKLKSQHVQQQSPATTLPNGLQNIPK